jgi:SAM-dependent methyltransferase
MSVDRIGSSNDRRGLAEVLTGTRRSYDTVAVDYAAANRPGLHERPPLERAMLNAFAEVVRAGDRRPVADVGCGPGNVTAYLRDLGLDVFGLDLSPHMVEQARKAHPGVAFEVGSMTDIDRPDGALGGIVSTYSIIHLPPDAMPALFQEFHRLLAPGGHLLLVFQIRSEPSTLQRWFDHEIELRNPRLQPDDVAGWLVEAGFTVQAQLRREADNAGETLPRASVLARR